MTYEEIVQRRRDLKIDGYLTLADVGFDGPWVTPYQKKSISKRGPVLVAHHWLDARTVRENRATLEKYGYLPGIPFNVVLDQALSICGITRNKLYVTQAFHLPPLDNRCQEIPFRHVEISFEAVTRHELLGRKVIALGTAAARACERHGIDHVALPHPSARGLRYQDKARKLAQAIIQTDLWVGRLTPRFRTFQVCPKDLRVTLWQAEAAED